MKIPYDPNRASSGIPHGPIQRRPIGRPHTCTPDVIERVCEALSVCASWNDAANYAGKNQKTVMEWKRRGREAVEAEGINPDDMPDDVHMRVRDPYLRPFAQFYQLTARARASAHVGLLAAAYKCSTGGPVYDEHGKLLHTITPDGRVGLKLLAMRSRDYVEKRHHEHSGPHGSPIAVTVYDAIRVPEEESDPPDSSP